MKAKNSSWKKGAGKLGVLSPLLGNWQANAESPMDKVRCTRTFTKILGGKYIHLVRALRSLDQKYTRSLLSME